MNDMFYPCRCIPPRQCQAAVRIVGGQWRMCRNGARSEVVLWSEGHGSLVAHLCSLHVAVAGKGDTLSVLFAPGRVWQAQVRAA